MQTRYVSWEEKYCFKSVYWVRLRKVRFSKTFACSKVIFPTAEIDNPGNFGFKSANKKHEKQISDYDSKGVKSGSP